MYNIKRQISTCMEKNKIFGRKKIIAFILIIGWIILLLYYHQYVTLLFTIPFVITVLYFQQSIIKVSSVIILLVFIFFTPTFDSIIQLRNNTISVYEDKKIDLREVLAPNSGLFSNKFVPNEVKEMLMLIDRFQLNDYQISKSMQENQSIFQRIVETAWPIKMEPFSQNLFFSIDDLDQYKGCIEIGRESEIVLVHCP